MTIHVVFKIFQWPLMSLLSSFFSTFNNISIFFLWNDNIWILFLFKSLLAFYDWIIFSNIEVIHCARFMCVMSWQSVAEVIRYLAIVTSFGWTVRWSVVKPSSVELKVRGVLLGALTPCLVLQPSTQLIFHCFAHLLHFFTAHSLSLWHNFPAQHSFSSSEYNLDITVHSFCHPVLRY